MLARRWRWMAALLLAIGLLPWVLALLDATTELWRPAFAILCHQLPDRSWSPLGHDMLVCSRCAGIFAGLSLGALLPLSRRMRHHGRTLVLGAIALNLMQAASQLALPHWHAPRLLCGLAFGWAATAFFIASLRAEAEQHRSLSLAFAHGLGSRRATRVTPARLTVWGPDALRASPLHRLQVTPRVRSLRSRSLRSRSLRSRFRVPTRYARHPCTNSRPGKVSLVYCAPGERSQP